MKFILKCFGVTILSAAGAFVIYILNHSDLASVSYQSVNIASVAQAVELKPEIVSILNFGDAMFGRKVGKFIHENGMDPFEFIKNYPDDIWNKADLIVLNLEGPISDATICQEKAYSFRFEPDTADLLARNKIGLVNLSNNHSADCYERGLSDTRIFLELSKIGYFGGGNVSESYIEQAVGDKIIAFVGINLTFDPRLDPSYLNLIKELKIRNDFVIVNIHWGTEYSKVAVNSQKTTGHKIIDAGADVIIGHHPHVIEPMEIYNSRPIFYSLGNFIFDQLELENNEGIGVKMDIDKNDWPTYEILPYKIENMQPIFFDKEYTDSFCDEFLKDYADKRVGDCGFKI